MSALHMRLLPLLASIMPNTIIPHIYIQPSAKIKLNKKSDSQYVPNITSIMKNTLHITYMFLKYCTSLARMPTFCNFVELLLSF